MGEKGGGWLGGGGEEGRTGPCHLQACSEFQVPPLCSDWRHRFLSHVEEGKKKEDFSGACPKLLCSPYSEG